MTPGRGTVLTRSAKTCEKHPWRHRRRRKNPLCQKRIESITDPADPSPAHAPGDTRNGRGSDQPETITRFSRGQLNWCIAYLVPCPLQLRTGGGRLGCGVGADMSVRQQRCGRDGRWRSWKLSPCPANTLLQRLPAGGRLALVLTTKADRVQPRFGPVGTLAVWRHLDRPRQVYFPVWPITRLRAGPTTATTNNE